MEFIPSLKIGLKNSFKNKDIKQKELLKRR